jgi:hypothetical protein
LTERARWSTNNARSSSGSRPDRRTVEAFADALSGVGIDALMKMGTDPTMAVKIRTPVRCRRSGLTRTRHFEETRGSLRQAASGGAR